MKFLLLGHVHSRILIFLHLPLDSSRSKIVDVHGIINDLPWHQFRHVFIAWLGQSLQPCHFDNTSFCIGLILHSSVVHGGTPLHQSWLGSSFAKSRDVLGWPYCAVGLGIDESIVLMTGWLVEDAADLALTAGTHQVLEPIVIWRSRGTLRNLAHSQCIVKCSLQVIVS